MVEKPGKRCLVGGVQVRDDPFRVGRVGLDALDSMVFDGDHPVFQIGITGLSIIHYTVGEIHIQNQTGGAQNE